MTEIVEIVALDEKFIPNYETKGSAGADLRTSEDGVLKSGQSSLIPTGLKIALPIGYEAQIRPRSGLAFKNKVTVLNSPGTIDSDYRGEVKVLLINHSNEDFIYKQGDRIAQMVINKIEQPTFYKVENLSETYRGEGGFGSTGTK